MYLYSSVLSDHVGISIKNSNLLTGLRLLTPTVCGNTTPARRSVFTQFRVFPIFTSVDITVYQYGKNVLYFFYNIAQRTLTEEWRKIFRVDINTALSQSAFRIYKCYIIILHNGLWELACEFHLVINAKIQGLLWPAPNFLKL